MTRQTIAVLILLAATFAVTARAVWWLAVHVGIPTTTRSAVRRARHAAPKGRLP